MDVVLVVVEDAGEKREVGPSPMGMMVMMPPLSCGADAPAAEEYGTAPKSGDASIQEGAGSFFCKYFVARREKGSRSPTTNYPQVVVNQVVVELLLLHVAEKDRISINAGRRGYLRLGDARIACPWSFWGTDLLTGLCIVFKVFVACRAKDCHSLINKLFLNSRMGCL